MLRVRVVWVERMQTVVRVQQSSISVLSGLSEQSLLYHVFVTLKPVPSVQPNVKDSPSSEMAGFGAIIIIGGVLWDGVRVSRLSQLRASDDGGV